MQKAAGTLAIAGILQLTIGFAGGGPCIASGCVTLAVAVLLAILGGGK